MVTGQQLRDACGLLGWSRYDLNRKTGLPLQIVDRLLSIGAELDATPVDVIITKDALSKAEIELIEGGAKRKTAGEF